MKRIALSVTLCAAVLGLGLATARQTARNRARAADLAARHHVCETRERQNQLLRVENERLAWLVLHAEDAAPDPDPRASFEN